ncbi:ornithine cyclodeaminase family protein [Streptomyces cavernicola]|uniref:Ornithine cyclodeaminase family protein n=1 Tax=Streptomyces cavernicola TaxID=3043613 RepID=A0ABT6S9F6_9ACTN|nr:ornithine cyclodeaminase family protein [Streptomyces sp. B-S-A6]MDI3404755.1 ornithine cyclodeaminase family protein [Streptomyces sp. B-S-A6]
MAQAAMTIDYIGAEDLPKLLPPREAVAAIRAALAGGLDPAADPARSILELPGGQGQLLSMPAASEYGVGVKAITAVPGNTGRGLPRIQGVHLVFRPPSYTPVAVVDGAALTTLRTPAVSVAAVLPFLTRPGRRWNTVVFGAGPQGTGHVRTLRDSGVDLADVTYVVRDPARVDRDLLGDDRVVAAGSGDSEALLRRADLVVCATPAAEPLFDSSQLLDTAVVLAVGSHAPDAREVDSAFAARAQVVVEDPATALRECGDIVLPVAEGVLSTAQLLPMAAVVRGDLELDAARPVLFKGSGMAWQDAVVADAAVRKVRRGA